MGFLGEDAEYRETRTGYELATFSVEADARDGGENKKLWFRCTIWGKRSKQISENLKKGDLVYISGTVRTVKDLDVYVSDIKKMNQKNDDEDLENEMRYCFEDNRYLCDSL